MNLFNLLRNKNNKYVKNRSKDTKDKNIEVKESKENNTLDFYDILNSIYKIININNDCDQLIYKYDGYIYTDINKHDLSFTFNDEFYYHINKNNSYDINIYGNGHAKLSPYSLNINYYKENNLWFSDNSLKKLIKIYNSFKLLLKELTILKDNNDNFYYYYLYQQYSLDNSQITLLNEIDTTFRKLFANLINILTSTKATNKNFINSDELIEECNKYNNIIKSNLLS